MNHTLARNTRPAPPHGMSTGRPSRRPAGTAKMPERNKAEDLFQVIRQLCDLLTKENAALKRHRTEEVKAMTERKQQLARVYQQQMNAVHREPEILERMDPNKRSALIQAGNRLTELMKDNASLLKSNIQSINTLVKTIVTAVREKQEEKSTSYSKAGHLDAYATVKRNLAVSFNEVT